MNNGKTLNLFGYDMKWCYKNGVFNSRKVNAFLSCDQCSECPSRPGVPFTYISVLITYSYTVEFLKRGHFKGLWTVLIQ